MISFATSGGRYLPSADWAKRLCSEPTARAAAPAPMKASSQPVAPAEGGQVERVHPHRLELEGQPGDRRDLDEQGGAQPPARQLEGAGQPAGRDQGRIAASHSAQGGIGGRHPPVELLREHMGVDLEPLHPAPR